ncbi:capsid cement protein [Kineococcus terrestris]|uniref:capsid cement protein n=1 Tax=Kineococcus terrestris TaxID=2044856 RepID=UPI0034DAEFF7
MPEYMPLFKPAAALPLTASAAVTGGQLLIVSGPGTVAPSTAASGAWIGVAAYDAATGQRLTVHTGSGVHLLTAAGAIPAGARVAAAANGQVADFGAGTDYSQIIGIALSSATAGQPVQVKLAR